MPTPLTRKMAAGLRRSAGWSFVVRLVLTLAWIAALVVALAGAPPCTPDDPSVCGPDVVFAWALVPLVGALVLTWIAPRAGCIAGIVFAVLELAFDDIANARWAFAGYGLLCVAYLWWLQQPRRSQPAPFARRSGAGRLRDVARGRTSSSLSPSEDDVRLARVLVRLSGGALLVAAAAGLALLGVGLGVAYGVQQHPENAHLDRATRAEAEILAVASDGDTWIDLRVGDGERRRVGVLETAPYRVGETVPVLVDPRDETWVRLVAEPADYTYWLTGAGLALVAAVVLALRRRTRRQRLAALALDASPTTSVMALFTDGTLLVWPDGVNTLDPGPPVMVVAASLAIERDHVDEFVDEVEAGPRHLASHHGEMITDDPDDPSDEQFDEGFDDDEVEEEFARTWRGEGPRERPRPAVLVGDVRAGGWVAAVLDDLVVTPDRPARLLPSRPLLRVMAFLAREPRPWWEDLPTGGAEPDDEVAAGVVRDTFDGEDLPGVPVPALPASEPIPPLPIVADQGGSRRLTGTAMLVFALIAEPAALVFAEGVGERILAVMVGVNLVISGADRRFERLRVCSDGLHLVSVFRTVTVPWKDLIGVRRAGDVLHLAWTPGEGVEVGPLRSPAWGSPEQIADRLGRIIMRVRDDAGGATPANAASDPRKTISLPGPLLGVGVVFIVEVLAALWWTLLR